MKRLSMAALVAAVVLASCVPAIGTAAVASGGESKTVPLGWAFYKGRLVQGFAFVHGRGAAAKRDGGGGGALYTFIARGARWRAPEPYLIDRANSGDVGANGVSAAMASALATWETAAATDVVGAGSITDDVLSVDRSMPDGRNEVYFSSTGFDQRTIAVTYLWGAFSGPAESREIIEWDMVFNAGLTEGWGDATVRPGVWDFPDIATHELGHTMGLGDLYKGSAIAQTMYGYADVGETYKRTLASGDVEGVRVLYR